MSGKAAIVDIDEANHLRSRGAGGVDPPIFLDEAKSGLAKLVDLGLLLGGELALDADEPLSLFQLFPQVRGVDPGKHAGDVFHQLVAVDDAGRIGVERGALDVGGEQPAVAVDDVRPMHGGGNVAQAAAGPVGGVEAEDAETKPQPPQSPARRRGRRAGSGCGCGRGKPGRRETWRSYETCQPSGFGLTRPAERRTRAAAPSSQGLAAWASAAPERGR